MSTITTNLHFSPIARTPASRAADGVIAGYIHSLAQAASMPAASGVTATKLRQLAETYGCGASRTSGLAARRRPALRRVPSPA